MSIIEDFSNQMIEEFNKTIENRTMGLLNMHKLPHDREELKKLGYEVIINFKNNTEIAFFKREVEIKLCKIVDVDKFNFVIRSNII